MSKCCFSNVAGVFCLLALLKRDFTGILRGLSRLLLGTAFDKTPLNKFHPLLTLLLFHFKNSLFVNSFKLKYYLLHTDLFIQILMK